MPSKLCPQCLSSSDPGASQCAQCGAQLERGGRSRPGPWTWVLVGLVLAGGVSAAVWFAGGEEASPHRTPDASPAALPPPAEVTPPEAPPAARSSGSTCQVLLAGERGAVAALALRGPTGQVTLFLPLSSLPLQGPLRDPGGREIPVRVLTHNLEHEFVLLTPLAPLPAGVVPLQGAPGERLGSGTELGVHDSRGDREPSGSARLNRRPANGRELLLDRELAPGTVLTVQGQAVGYAIGGARAVTLDRALDWVGQTGTRELAVVQAELRDWLPGPILAEVGKLIAPPSSVESARQALLLMERLGPRLRERDQIDDFDALLRQVHHLLVRLLAQTDPAAALEQANAALARLPDHAGLLADAAVLSAEGGAPAEAMQLYLQLRMQSRAHAQDITDRFAQGLLHQAQQRMAESRPQEAIDILTSLAQLMPTRADVQAALAAALADADRLPEAIAAAETAARLDPVHQAALDGYRTALERARDPGIIEIPFDPATGAIRAEVRVGGVPIELVVDTGASLTSIPRSLADRLGLWREGLPVVRVTTANGSREAEVVEIPELSIGTLRVAAVQAVILDLDDSLAGKGLLGLNVLQRLNMRLDGENGVLILERPGRSRR